MRKFYYPKNLKASPSLWFWAVKDFVILGVLVFTAVILGGLARNLYFLCIPMVWAVLTVRMDEKTIWDALCCACRFFSQGSKNFTGTEVIPLCALPKTTDPPNSSWGSAASAITVCRLTGASC